jgi:hypothetical protein
MKLYARLGGGAGLGEMGPKLALLRNRLLDHQSANAEGSAELRAGRWTPACQIAAHERIIPT